MCFFCVCLGSNWSHYYGGDFSLNIGISNVENIQCVLNATYQILLCERAKEVAENHRLSVEFGF